MSESVRSRGRPKDDDLIARRKAEILTEAARFFAETGYPQADIQVLAERIGVGKGTVYRYFPTKEALFFAAVDEGMRALVDTIDNVVRDEKDPIHHIRSGVRAYLGYFDEHPELVELLIIERAEFRNRKQATYFIYKERNHDRRRAVIEKGIKSGVLRKMPPDRIIDVISDTLYGVIFTNHFTNRKVPFDQQAEEVIDVLLNGILSPGDRSKEL